MVVFPEPFGPKMTLIRSLNVSRFRPMPLIRVGYPEVKASDEIIDSRGERAAAGTRLVRTLEAARLHPPAGEALQTYDG
jgi:hypothetical protein